jgi:hypothetical protein
MVQLEGDKKDYNNIVRKDAQGKRIKKGQEYREAFCAHEEGAVVSLDSMKKYEKYLKIGILIIHYQGMRTIRKPSKRRDGRMMCFLYHKNEGAEYGHYSYVNRDHIGALWKDRKYCFECYQGYQINAKHSCIKTCDMCEKADCSGSTQPKNEAQVMCNACNLFYYDEQCLETHRKTLCARKRRCLQCKLIYDVDKKHPHQCEKRLCSNCKRMVDRRFTHQCYHQVVTDEDLKKPSMDYIFYDYESMLADTGEHTVAGAVAMYADSDEVFQFRNNEDFMVWLFRKEHKGYTVIAHNAGRYDLHFIKKHMIANGIASSDIW